MSTKFSQFSTNNILLRILEHMSYIKLCAKYSSHQYTYSNIIINNLIFNRPCNALSKYKDFIILNGKKEFVHRFYSIKELFERLKKICDFYDLYTKIFPNYIILNESKYIYKNIRKKQKMIDAVNKLKYEKNFIKEYEIHNNCFDNEVFKGPLFTEEVEYEIAKDNMINNSNYINNENKGDSLFNQSLYIYLKNENNGINNKDKKEIEIKPNISIESFIANNESNLSLYNIMDILNENKIYVNDLRFLIDNKENININNKGSINKNSQIENNNQIKKSEAIKEIFIKSNKIKEMSDDLNKLKNNNSKNEDDSSNKNINNQKFPSISGNRKNKKTTNKDIKNNKDNKDNKDNNKDMSNINDKSENISKDIKRNSKKIIHQVNNNSKKVISTEKSNNNYYRNKAKKLKEKLLFLNNNTNEYSHLQILPRMETINYNNQNLLTKINQNANQNEKIINRNNTKEKNISKNNTLTINKITNIKKHIRYKHISQDLYSNYTSNNNKSKEKENNSVKKNNFNFYKNISTKLDKTNPKIKNEIINSRSTIGINKATNSNKDLNNIKQFKKSNIINNQIIIQNNNNYFLTENNNPNLITGTNKINYDTDDYDTEREKLLTYLVEIKTDKGNKNNKDINMNNLRFSNINTETSNKININNSQKIKKIKNGKYLEDLIKKHKTEKKFKKNYKYYFNHINNSTNLNYPIIKYNTIRKIHYYKRNNSNFTEKLINSINSISKIKKYNSNCSLKTEEYISPNKNLMKTINCYSHIENKSKSKNAINNISNNRNRKNKILSKIKTSTKNLKYNKNYLQVSDFVASDSTRNILSQRLRKKRTINKNEILIIDNNNKNLTINKIDSYKNKRQNTEFKFKTSLTKNKFSSCDFDSIKYGNNNFSKGLLDRINNIKSKINEGIYKNNQSNIIKRKNNLNYLTNKLTNITNNYSTNDKIYEYKEKKNIKNLKAQKIYENKMLYNDNKENIQSNLIKVNKTRYFGSTKSQLYINTDIVYNRYNNTVCS